MPTYKLTSPEGISFKVTAPEGATQDQVIAFATERLKSATPPEPKNPTEDMSGLQKFGAGAGKAFYDVGRGVGQIAGVVPQADVDAAKSRDTALMKTGAGLGGNIAGNASIFAPTAFIPGANTYTGAALVGSGMGALQPVATGESRGVNAAIGGGAGIAGQAIGRGISRVIQPIKNALGPQENQLVQAAGREGIPLTAGQRTGSRPLQITESVMENLPFTSGPQLAQREAQQRAFTKAALGKAGVVGDSAEASVLLDQKKNLGVRMGDIAKQNSLDFNRGLSDRLSGIVQEAKGHLPPQDAEKVAGTVNQILQNIKPGSPERVVASSVLSESGAPFTNTIPAVPSGPMSGTNYQGWRGPLRGLASEGGATGRYYGQIRSALDSAFKDQLSGLDGEAFKEASRKYANLKTIIDAMGGAGNLPAKGQVAPAQLSAALARSVGRENKALGVGDMNELARVGQSFVREQIPNSGTAQRQFIQNLITGNVAGALPGAGIGYYEGGSEGALLGGMLGAGVTMGGPRALQMLINSPAGQAYLANGLAKVPPQVLNAIPAATSVGLPASVVVNR